MADTTGQPAAHLINDLLTSGHEFTFPQVMRLARMQLDTGGRDTLPGVPWQKRVRVRPELSLAFPPADVARVEREAMDLKVTTTFLGLYGSSSPLPSFYTEDLMDEASGDSSVSRDFLDILHQRLYQLYFQCWSKYRLFIRVAEEKNPLDRERLFCLIGLGEQELRDNQPDAWSLLRYAGLLTQFPRSAEGLRALLRDALGVTELEVQQCVVRRVPIPADQRLRMGASGMRLGTTTVLGTVVSDRMGKFRILIGPLRKQQFDQFLPAAPLHRKLVALVRLYLIDPLDFDLNLTLAAHEAGPIRLGDPLGPRLGWSTWCFSARTIGEVSSRFPLALSAKQDPVAVDEEIPAPQPSTLTDYYQQELAELRELTTDYVRLHPEMAPLVSGHMADPGVERIIEGTAFLNAHLRQKLDDDFPEVIHGVMDVLQPESLRPVPASSIVVFLSKPGFMESHMIPAGIELSSVPVDGVNCRFTTRFPVEIHPLTLTDASISQPSGKAATITLSLKLHGIILSNWIVKSLRLFLAGETKQATNLYLVLLRYVKRIVIAPRMGGQQITLDPTHLTPAGFDDKSILFPTTASDVSNHRLFTEYFIQPLKFLFIDLLGWESWIERGEGSEFEIRFELDPLPFALQRVCKDDFALFATPVVNQFDHRSEPIESIGQKTEYAVKPAESQLGQFEICSVKSVTGMLNNSGQKISFKPGHQGVHQSLQAPSYQVTRRSASIGNGIDTFISIEIPHTSVAKHISSLIVELSCTNGKFPERLKTGDIFRDSDNSPVCASFTNCKPVTKSEYTFLGGNTLWKLYSQCNLNISLLNANILRSVLRLISQPFSQDAVAARLNINRIQGITGLQITAVDRLLGRSVLRGWEIRITLDGDFYDSPGDLYLFGVMLDHFLREFATESCFTRTIIEDVQSGKWYDFPVKMGKRCVI